MGYIQQSRAKARGVALGGMLSALSVAFMSLGSIIPSLDMSSAFIAGIVVIIARLEISRGAPVSVYLVSGILSLILLPNRFSGICYLLFYGLYPIIKEYIERIKLKPLKAAVKLAVFFCLYTAMLKIGEYFTVATDDILDVAEPVLYVIGMLTAIIYDFFLTLVVTRYDVFVSRFKSRLKNKKQ